MSKVHGKRYAYKFDFQGLSAAQQQQQSHSLPAAPTDYRMQPELFLTAPQVYPGSRKVSPMDFSSGKSRDRLKVWGEADSAFFLNQRFRPLPVWVCARYCSKREDTRIAERPEVAPLELTIREDAIFGTIRFLLTTPSFRWVLEQFRQSVSAVQELGPHAVLMRHVKSIFLLVASSLPSRERVTCNEFRETPTLSGVSEIPWNRRRTFDGLSNPSWE